MRTKKTELDVDFIGGKEHLTKDEEKAISNYLRAKKSRKLGITQSSSSTKRGSVVA